MTETAKSEVEKLDCAVDFLKPEMAGFGKPEVGLVLGSGMSGYARTAAFNGSPPGVTPYTSIPYLIAPTVPGHEGTFWWGTIGGRKLAIMAGRIHCYEGYSPKEVARNVRLMIRLGAKTIILTNAAGAINQEYGPGQLALVKDHINLLGVSVNPLVGANEDELGSRFPDMTGAYNQGLIQHATERLADLHAPAILATYAMMLGPQYETPGEIRMLKTLGADTVGMSIVPETLAARHMGAKVLAVSMITNMAAGIKPNHVLSHDEVKEETHKAMSTFTIFMDILIGSLPRD